MRHIFSFTALLFSALSVAALAMPSPSPTENPLGGFSVSLQVAKARLAAKETAPFTATITSSFFRTTSVLVTAAADGSVFQRRSLNLANGATGTFSGTVPAMTSAADQTITVTAQWRDPKRGVQTASDQAQLQFKSDQRLLRFPQSVVQSMVPAQATNIGTHAQQYCGSNTETFLRELSHTDPKKATVNYEWARINTSGNPMTVLTGTVSRWDNSEHDLLFAHPFGKDLDISVSPDPGFDPLLTSGMPNNGELGIHEGIEISQGLLPHIGGSPIGGFQPVVGDSVAAMGNWIVDCGHADFHTEIHPPRLLAVARATGAATMSYFFINPYDVTQKYTQYANEAADFSNAERLNRGVLFPLYFYNQIMRVETGSLGALEAHPLVASTVDADLQSVNWQVCAPAASSPLNSQFHYAYHILSRTGVNVSVAPNASTGCAAVQATIYSGYRPMPLTRKFAAWPWAQINKEANFDVQKAVRDDLGGFWATLYNPEAAGNVANHDPIIDVYDPLNPRDPLTGYGQTYTGLSADNQPYPIVGWVQVSYGNKNAQY